MRIKLKDLKPNPFRDFAVDPVDEGQVAVLEQSIKDNDFWGGIVARITGNGIETIAGEHRRRAALKSGIETADIYVAPLGKISDADAIRIYATENATHRGSIGTGRAGSVASAIKFLARGLLTGDHSGFPEWVPAYVERMRDNLANPTKGIGEPSISEFLHDIPGINSNSVKQQIANLKASGIYDRLIGEVQAELAAIEKAKAEAEARAEAERKAAQEAAERAAAERKAADEKRAREREEARAAKEKRDAEIAKENEAKKKKALEEKAKRDAETAEKAEAKRKAAEAHEKERAAENAKRQKEAEAKAAETKAAREKAAIEKAAADRAKAAAAEQERKLREEHKAFDFVGVSKHIHVAENVDFFREYVTLSGIAQYVARDEQAALAAQLVAEYEQEKERAQANKRSGGFSMSFNTFVRENIMDIVQEMKRANRQADEAERRAAEEADFNLRAKRLMTEFDAKVRGAHTHLLKLLRMQKQHPEIELKLSLTFMTAIKIAIETLDMARAAGLTQWLADDLFTALRGGGAINGSGTRASKIAGMLASANASERHVAADKLFEMAREQKKTMTELLRD